ncbi:hypothetical protein LMIY3S_03643 [Labrys miyagiensis]
MRSWLPNGKRHGNSWRVGSVNGEEGNSLAIDLRSGKWIDHAGTSQSGGDLISLYAEIKRVPYQQASTEVATQLENLRGTSLSNANEEKSRIAIMPVPEGVTHNLSVGMVFRSNLKLVRWWEYRDSEGRLLTIVTRFEAPEPNGQENKPKKEILPYSYFGPEEGWLFKGTGLPKNPLYGLPDLAQRPDAPILLVEGEKACDAARRLFPDYVSMSWLGGSNRVRKADFAPLAGRQVVYWPDNDNAGRSTIASMSEAMRECGAASLQIVKLPIGLPEKWDVADELPDAFDLVEIFSKRQDIDLRSLKPFHDLAFAELLSRLVYNSGTEQFIDVETGFRHSKPQLDDLFAHVKEEKGRISAFLLSNPKLRKSIALTYQPGNEERLIIDQKGHQKLNLWRPSNVGSAEAAASDADAAPFIEHLRFLCPTDAEYSLLVDCLAFMIQRRGEKLMFAPVLVGKQGTGKSALATIMRRLLGDRNSTTASTIDIRSGFNDWIAEKELVVVEEIMALGRTEIMNTLKPLITEHWISINTKHVRRYEIENKANFIFLSNHEDALRLDDDDRRYFVITNRKEPKQPEYYREFFAWAENNLPIIQSWLLSRDIASFNPKKAPPSTVGKLKMIELSKDARETLIAQLIAENEYPFDVDLIESKIAWQQLVGGEGLTTKAELSYIHFQAILKKLGAIGLGQQKANIEGRTIRPSLWAVRNTRRYQEMASQHLVEVFLDQRKTTYK